MRIGLIGLGRIGAFHAETLSTLPSVTSLVVTDAVPAVTRTIADSLGAESVGSPEELLASGVDAVVIAAATDAHPRLLIAAIESGLPVFCEKPVARTMAEGLEMAKRVDQLGATVQIGYPRRFDAGFQAARRAVASGELGWLHTIRSTTLDPAPPPEAYLAVSGGIFRDSAVHDFDAIRWVTGREVVEVWATGSARGNPMFALFSDVATAATVLTLDDGALALVSNTRFNPRGHDVRLELHGSRDSIGVGWSEKLPLRSVEAGVSFPSHPPYTFFMDRFQDAFRAELAAFTDLVAGGHPSPCTVAEALEAGWIAEAATQSLQERRPVRIAEVRPSTNRPPSTLTPATSERPVS
jgi:myo-inositol 2-dehydrogenase/D-chiro-inositol 1-dehydrogenase